jgi:hypothetical protein
MADGTEPEPHGRNGAAAPPAADSDARLAAAAAEREPDAVYLVTSEQVAFLDRLFDWHPPRAGQLERYEALRARARDVAFRMLAWCPDGREREFALLHLEQAVTWAVKSIARNE